MQSTSITPWQTCYYYIPNHFNYLKFHNKTLLFPSQFSHIPSTSTNKSLITLSSTHSTSCQQEQENHKNNSDQHRQNHLNLQELYSSVEKQKPHQTKDKIKQQTAMITHSSIKTNSWWAVFKAAFGQRINVQGISSSVGILYKEQHLIIPHVFVKDIRYIDWAELKNRGFQGVIFDKDNTITVPYSLNLWAPLASSIDECKSLFGDNIAVFSNSAGLDEYDPDGRKARILERAIGIKVIRHRVKKPAGTAEEIERQFGCESSRLIMVGDRPFTDIVYGNRNGFLTILTEPLSLSQEPFIVKQVRILEMALVNRWSRKGIKPISHRLLPDYQRSAKDEPL